MRRNTSSCWEGGWGTSYLMSRWVGVEHKLPDEQVGGGRSTTYLMSRWVGEERLSTSRPVRGNMRTGGISAK